MSPKCLKNTLPTARKVAKSILNNLLKKKEISSVGTESHFCESNAYYKQDFAFNRYSTETIPTRFVTIRHNIISSYGELGIFCSL